MFQTEIIGLVHLAGCILGQAVPAHLCDTVQCVAVHCRYLGSGQTPGNGLTTALQDRTRPAIFSVSNAFLDRPNVKPMANLEADFEAVEI